MLVVDAVFQQAKLSIEDSLQPAEAPPVPVAQAVVAPPVVALALTLPEKDMQQIVQAVVGILQSGGHRQDCRLRLPQLLYAVISIISLVFTAFSHGTYPLLSALPP